MYEYAIIDGISSIEYSFYLGEINIFEIATRAVDVIDIPGKNGSLTLDNGSYNNVERSYTFYTRNIENMHEFEAFLSSRKGYVRIEDTIASEYFYCGYITGYEVGGTGTRTGSITVRFSCKPQRYLISGEQKTIIQEQKSIYNPTFYDALPLIRVYGAGWVRVDSVLITILKNAKFIDIDSELMDAYCEGINCNANISISGFDFPVLKAKSKNVITFGGSVYKIEITPRWWTI